MKMIEQTKCRDALYSKELSGIVGALTTSSATIQCIEMLELDELLEETPVERYEYQKSFAQAQTDPVLVLHSSGSTGTAQFVGCCVILADFSRRSKNHHHDPCQHGRE